MIKEMEDYLGNGIEVVDENGDFKFAMDLFRVARGKHDASDEYSILHEVEENEFPVFVDRDELSYCTLDYVKNNQVRVI